MAEEDEDDDDEETKPKTSPLVSETLAEDTIATDNNPMDVDLDSRPPPSTSSTPDDEAHASAVVTQL